MFLEIDVSEYLNLMRVYWKTNEACCCSSTSKGPVMLSVMWYVIVVLSILSVFNLALRNFVEMNIKRTASPLNTTVYGKMGFHYHHFK